MNVWLIRWRNAAPRPPDFFDQGSGHGNNGRGAGLVNKRALLSSFRALGHFIIMLAESSSQVRALNQLGQLSDHNLCSKGLKRSAKICRILGAAAAI